MQKKAIQSRIHPAECKRCGKQWEVFHFEDAFQIEDVPLRCDGCRDVKWVNIFEDADYFKVFKAFSKKTKVSDAAPFFGRFYREFEKTCPTCFCGGTYRIQNGACPTCDSSLIDVDTSRLLRTETIRPVYLKQ